TGILGRDATDMAKFYDQARVLIDTPGVNDIFSFTADDRARYGSTTFGDSLVVARNIVAANRGARFVQVTHGGWDHHDNIYNRAANNSLYSQSKTFDDGFGALMTDLASRPGSQSGRTLLDETLVVVLGEFGRTTGALKGSATEGGRDHYLRMSLVMAGGGVRGGRALGVTDAGGNQALDFGWSAGRDVRPEDVTATIYSALGIDYTTVRQDDPLGRGFEYVPFANDEAYLPIEELF
ncbi:MAG TPA: DUF1501 domain-containing protein, partial [Thermoanaerobaculia bacterium]|nr:DUF1501 domain-containing protein [Thermoanaerobaculia bacterium]